MAQNLIAIRISRSAHKERGKKSDKDSIYPNGRALQRHLWYIEASIFSREDDIFDCPKFLQSHKAMVRREESQLKWRVKYSLGRRCTGQPLKWNQFFVSVCRNGLFFSHATHTTLMSLQLGQSRPSPRTQKLPPNNSLFCNANIEIIYAIHHASKIYILAKLQKAVALDSVVVWRCYF